MTTDTPSTPKQAYGSWGRRVVAYFLDSTLLPIVVAAPILGVAALLRPVSDALGLTVVVLAYVAVFGFLIEQLIRQGRQGATIGKWLMGLRLVDAGSGQPIRVGRSFARPFVHIIDALPLYAGYLAPLFDRQRRTFTDRAMSTVVLRVPGPRTGVLLPGLVASTAVLLLVGAITVYSDLAESATQGQVSAGSTAAAAPTTPKGPPPPATVAAAAPKLAPEDLEGRLAPVADGFAPVSDEVSELGPLDVQAVAELAATSPEEAGQAADGLRQLGLQEALGHGYDNARSAYTVVVYRFPDVASAIRFTQAVSFEYDYRPSSVNGAVVYDLGEPGEAMAGIFPRGAYAYEVTLLGDPGTAQQPALEQLLQRQYDHAAAID